MIDLIEAIEAEAVDLTLVVTAKTYDADGVLVAQPGAPIGFLGTIQPVSGRVLKDLPEGMRSEAVYTLWTRTPVAIDNVVIYGLERLRVMRAKPRPEGGFIRAVLGKTK